MKKSAIVLAGIGLVVAAVWIIGVNLGKNGAVNSAPTISVPVNPGPATNVPPTSASPPKLGGTKPTPKPNAKDAVSAASLANSNLSLAQLLPKEQMRQVVTTTAIPTKRPVLERAYVVTGVQLAKFWGYPSVDDARMSSQYSISTQKYHIDSLKGPVAVIRLYTISHWVSHQNLEYWVPSITVIQMRWMRGQWYYYGSHDPPATQMPVPKSNLSYNQTVRRFQPFLRGFKPYEGA